ncbi:hypothetical protein AX15_005070 [Amanita polypyramis BW_CC]|nr:hypothetical protein AX15_005070 [Amanita polypyramis BW_CC]
MWYQGNIYNFEKSIPQIVDLPVKPSFNLPTTYTIFVSGDYEIRLFGDPHTAGHNVPIQRLNLSVELEECTETVIHEPTQDIVCDFVEGIAFGTAIGVGLRSVSGWWTVRSATLLEPFPDSTFNLDLLREVRISPSQTRIVPVIIIQRGPVYSRELRLSLSVEDGKVSRSITLALPTRQLECWNAQSHEPIRGTYFYATSMPTYFVAIPPRFPKVLQYCPPILALHGAGVEVMRQTFWVESLPRQQHSWILVPTGRTSWGLDWHGPSAQDAWDSVRALAGILDLNDQWRLWGYPADGPVVVVGHSNGGQGAWYLASRFPDRVLGVVPAAAYIKSQAYVPLTLSRSAHYIDPMLRAILESSLAPDDNDLHLSNLMDVPVCAIHGGNDENVPVWHTREAISVLKTWYSETNALYQEVQGKGHWYPSVFRNDVVALFLKRILLNPSTTVTSRKFMISVASPIECGSVRGWRVEELLVSGRLGRMQVELAGDKIARVITFNIHAFSIDRRRCAVSTVVVDTTDVTLGDHDTASSTIHFERNKLGKWEVVTRLILSHLQPSGRLQMILMSTDSITIIIPRKGPSHELTIALRLVHDLHLFHRLDAEVLDENEAFVKIEEGIFTQGNLIIVGSTNMKLAQHVLSLQRTPFSLEDSILTLNGHELDFDKSESAVLFLHPQIDGSEGLIMFMLSSSEAGFERAIRLFPIRTGIAAPDWLVIGKQADQLSAAGIQAAGLWGRQWSWNQVASWNTAGFD